MGFAARCGVLDERLSDDRRDSFLLPPRVQRQIALERFEHANGHSPHMT
jgi:hypothetical protein